ncbi:putative transposase [Candidatus Jettenia caeni]|uniref:Transposase n=1 Tax=Candidatus Jettenia caeni TaxID=247490 RepID=I3IKW9_9BACT|nr:transposase [Candidatus Jettenia caeni]GAB62364.1 putative transposase [Candidatus Jettenia caeni]
MSFLWQEGYDIWIKNSLNTLPNTTWQHITFTMPEELWIFFWLNRSLLNRIPLIAATLIKDWAQTKGFLPGIFLAIHTFGRDLKKNIHIHLSTTAGGLSPCHTRWIGKAYFYHESLKNTWRYKIITLLRNEFKQGLLKLPSHLKHLTSSTLFNSWTSQFFEKTWVIHLKGQSNSMKAHVDYPGKYLKRPPIGETRIKDYDGTSVTYEYLDHSTKTQEIMTLPVLEFIARLICHIPDKHFRNIRYYGFLSHKLRGKLLPLVYNLLKMNRVITGKVSLSWRDMIRTTYRYDPLLCPRCKTRMVLQSAVFASDSLITQHKEIAHGYFPLLL